jgi:predicted CoA-binding protein
MAMIERFLSRPAMALIGMSRSGKKFGNAAYRALVSKGYRVYPIHPIAATIGGVKCYTDYAALPEGVDAALIVVPPAQAIAAIRAAAAAGVRSVWLQQGAESEDAIKECRDRGLEVISGECILMFARPTGIHKAHRWIWGALGKLPA